MKELRYSDVSRLLRADLDAGKLYWLLDGSAPLGAGASCDASEAFTTPHIRGYRAGRILGQSHLAHRVIWLLATGSWPEGQIDHINGVRDDNRMCNLRVVDSAENSKNQGRYKNNKSGVTGVLWHKSMAKWRSQIRINGREIHLGYFTDFDAAVAARKAADVKFGFHENHGRVAA